MSDHTEHISEANMLDIESMPSRDELVAEIRRLRELLAKKADGKAFRLEVPTPESPAFVLTGPSEASEQRMGEMLRESLELYVQAMSRVASMLTPAAAEASQGRGSETKNGDKD